MIARLIRSVLGRAGFDIVRREHQHAALADHLVRVFDRYAIDCVLDVGANTGQYGRMLRAAGFAGHIVSFEPVAAVFDQLREGARGDPTWLCHPIALGVETGRRAMNVYGSSVFSSFHAVSPYARDAWTGLDDPVTEEVAVCRLDDILPDIRRETGASRFFLKLDTQGHDLPAFDGARGSLRAIPAMQSELSMIPVYDATPGADEALAAFRAGGYAISGMYPINRDASLAVVEFDCILVRRDAG